ncbi:hypothetical protein PLICRDRAFT_172945 [Plicaturopsis crispa FD-325 SS-3]|nr:hypothetical protein PLICRDRAFT_172945 [Plicaturopsis crispa FD-325 SS-3]
MLKTLKQRFTEFSPDTGQERTGLGLRSSSSVQSSSYRSMVNKHWNNTASEPALNENALRRGSPIVDRNNSPLPTETDVRAVLYSPSPGASIPSSRSSQRHTQESLSTPSWPRLSSSASLGNVTMPTRSTNREHTMATMSHRPGQRVQLGSNLRHLAGTSSSRRPKSVYVRPSSPGREPRNTVREDYPWSPTDNLDFNATEPHGEDEDAPPPTYSRFDPLLHRWQFPDSRGRHRRRQERDFSGDLGFMQTGPYY